MSATETFSNEQRDAVRAVLRVFADVIRELGQIPAGHLYALVMDRMSLEVFERSMAALVASGLVRREASHLLVWTGPAKEKGL